MPEQEHLLVAIDIGKNTENFCQQAIEIAKKLDATVTLVHAIEYIPYYPYFPYDEEKIEADLTLEINSKLESLKELFKTGGIKINEFVVKKDKAYKAICEVADNIKASRIIIGVGPHYLLENMIGSTAEKVVRQAKQAVFLINPYKNITSVNRILCGYDFTDNCDKALLSASKMARKFSAEFNILHVIPENFFSSSNKDDLETAKSKIIADIQNKIDTLDTGEHKVKIHIQSGNAVLQISEFVEKNDIDLLIIGTYSHNAITRLFLGSTTEKIVRKAPCNIMTFKQV